MEERPNTTPTAPKDAEVEQAMRQVAAEQMIIQSIKEEDQHAALSELDIEERNDLFAEVLDTELGQAKQESAEVQSQVSAPEQPKPKDRKPHTEMQDGFNSLNS